MPRTESRISQVRRITRSSRINPLWDTIVFLQRRVDYLTRQLRQKERARQEIERERIELSQEVEELLSRVSSFRELELENQNLQREVLVLRSRLAHLNARGPVPLNRTYSSYDFA